MLGFIRLHSGLERVCSESKARRYASLGDSETCRQLRLRSLKSGGDAIKRASSPLRSLAQLVTATFYQLKKSSNGVSIR